MPGPYYFILFTNPTGQRAPMMEPIRGERCFCVFTTPEKAVEYLNAYLRHFRASPESLSPDLREAATGRGVREAAELADASTILLDPRRDGGASLRPGRILTVDELDSAGAEPPSGRDTDPGGGRGESWWRRLGRFLRGLLGDEAGDAPVEEGAGGQPSSDESPVSGAGAGPQVAAATYDGSLERVQVTRTGVATTYRVRGVTEPQLTVTEHESGAVEMRLSGFHGYGTVELSSDFEAARFFPWLFRNSCG